MAHELFARGVAVGKSRTGLRQEAWNQRGQLGLESAMDRRHASVGALGRGHVYEIRRCKALDFKPESAFFTKTGTNMQP